MNLDTFNFRRKAIQAAKDLGYGKEVITKLKSSSTQTEMCRILATERCRKEIKDASELNKMVALQEKYSGIPESAFFTIKFRKEKGE